MKIIPAPADSAWGFPDWLRPLTSIVVAVLNRDGTLIDANTGFTNLIALDDVSTAHLDISACFLAPRFDQLLERDAANSIVHEGIFNLGALDMNNDGQSLRGVIYLVEDKFLVVGELDVGELTQLNSVVMALNHELSDTQRKLVRANQALEQEREKLRELTVTDPLTGLANRRQLDDKLAYEISRAARTGRPLSIIMADLDHFKRINDKLGHEAGDELLKLVAGIMQDCTRSIDLAARYGGEEFIILAPECSAGDAVKLAERIRSGVQTQSKDKVDREISISLGVATLLPNEDAKSVLQRADEAMYRAKATGRNRTVSAITKSGNG